MTRHSVLRNVRGVVLAAVLITASVAVPASALSAPAGLAFYSPPKRLIAGPHGSVIWARSVPSSLSAAAREYLVLYRSRSIDGKQIVVSGLVDIPEGRAPAAGWPVVSWAHPTTGVADVCAPSRQPAASAFPILNAWLDAGYAVVRTDYEGLGTPGAHPYLIGRSEAHGVIDIIRAARQLDSRIGRRFAITGYSQGGQAALWAAALAPRWAPRLHLRGVAAFAPGSHTARLIRLDPTALGVLMVLGATAADPGIRLDRVLSDQALALMPHVQHECVFDLARPDEFGTLTPDQLLRSGADLSRLFSVLAAQDPALRIRVPILILQGETDQDVPFALTDQVVHQLKAKGDAVTYRTFPGADHFAILNSGASAVAAFLATRLG
jgi:pimeloyl-ACP methyl ester carboxylesterase